MVTQGPSKGSINGSKSWKNTPPNPPTICIHINDAYINPYDYIHNFFLKKTTPSIERTWYGT